MATELEINLTDFQMHTLQAFAMSRDAQANEIAADLLTQSLADLHLRTIPQRDSGLVIPFKKRGQE